MEAVVFPSGTCEAGESFCKEMVMGICFARASRTGAAALFIGSIFTAPLAASAADIFYSGRATGVDGQVSAGGKEADVLLGDTGMSCQGLPHDESVASISSPDPLQTSANNVHVYTLGKDGKAVADATMEHFTLSSQGVDVSADSIGAHARAVCDVASGVVTVTGHSDFSNVVVNGQPIDPATKNSVKIPNVGYVYFDQHRHYSNEMRVYAIHVRIDNPSTPASGDIYIGEVRAKTICNK
jgi:hypothetical protein